MALGELPSEFYIAIQIRGPENHVNSPEYWVSTCNAVALHSLGRQLMGTYKNTNKYGVTIVLMLYKVQGSEREQPREGDIFRVQVPEGLLEDVTSKKSLKETGKSIPAETACMKAKREDIWNILEMD